MTPPFGWGNAPTNVTKGPPKSDYFQHLQNNDEDKTPEFLTDPFTPDKPSLSPVLVTDL